MKSGLSSVLIQVAKGVALFILGLVLLGLLISFFYEKEVKRMMVEKLNASLDTKVEVKEFDFSVFRHFPYASLDMQDVLVWGTEGSAAGDTLLFTHHFSLLFNVFGIFKKDVSVRRVVLTGGALHIRMLPGENNNYHIWKKPADSAASSSLDIQDIRVRNMRMDYSDPENGQFFAWTTSDAELAGKFSDQLYNLMVEADLFIDHLKIGDVDYIPGKKITVDSGLEINNTGKVYNFHNSRVTIEDLSFDVGGDIRMPSGRTLLNLSVKAHEADLKDFISLLPARYVEYFRKFDCEGKCLFESTIRGNTSAPAFDIAFSVQQGKVTPENSPVSLNQIQLDGTFRLDSSGKNILSVPAMKASLGNHPISGGFSIENFRQPYLDMHARAEIDLSQAKSFVAPDTLESLSGLLRLDFSFAGRIGGSQNGHSLLSDAVKASGNAGISNLSFSLKKNPLVFQKINGIFSLENNNILVNTLSGNISSTDFQVSGLFHNALNFIFIPGQSGTITGKFTSSKLDLDELLSDKSSQENDTSYIMKFNPRLVADLDASIGKIVFRKFSASRVQGKISLNQQVISGSGLTFSSMNGMVYMDASINASRKDSIFMSCNARFNRIDITRLFHDLENFDQETMTDKNVKGNVTADVQFASVWTKSFSIDPGKTRATADISIENGELINFTPILALSKYIKVPDLNHIRFSNLRNQISISDRKIYIPSMEIKSSALNLTASGVHDFDNRVDYHLKLLLSDVLGKKMKDNKSEFGEIEDDGLGRSQLFLTMRGPVDNPKFAPDTRAMGNKIKTDIASEKQNLKAILKDEFGLFKKDTIQIKKKKKDEMQIDWENDEH